MNKIKTLILLLILGIVVPTIVYCQPQPDGNDVDTPIDGGVSILIAAGAVLGAKKFRDARLKK